MPRRGRRSQVIDDSDEEMPMPSQTRRRRVNVAVDDDDDGDSMNVVPSQSRKSQGPRKSNKSQTQNRTQNDDDFSPTQSSQSRSQKGLNVDELNRLMGHAVRYILVADRSRQPILRTNIQKNILDSTKHYRSVMDLTISTLKKVFGYNLIDLDNGKYILVNEIRNEHNHITFPSEKSQMVLLFYCLSHIFMNDEVCSEDNLFHFLRKLLGLDGDNFKHDYFGDVHNLVSVEFTKQRYLTRSKIENSNPEKFQYQWGARAENELDKLEILQFVSKIYRNKPVKEWISQLKNIDPSRLEDLDLDNDSQS